MDDVDGVNDVDDRDDFNDVDDVDQNETEVHYISLEPTVKVSFNHDNG